MIKYVSTRGGASGTFTDTILEGLASDGGLLVPENYEVVSEERLARPDAPERRPRLLGA